jgi:hypothetical protein
VPSYQIVGQETAAPVPAGDDDIIGRYPSANRDRIGVVGQIAGILEQCNTSAVTTLLDSREKSGAKAQGIARGMGLRSSAPRAGSERGICPGSPEGRGFESRPRYSRRPRKGGVFSCSSGFRASMCHYKLGSKIRRTEPA